MAIDRRAVLRGVATGGVAGMATLAGCATREGDPEPPAPGEDDEPDEPEDEGTLRIATTRAFAATEDSASVWLTEAFEEEFEDAEVEWVIPESGIDHYIERSRRGFLPDVDAYVGLTAADLARVDTELGDGTLFRPLNWDRIETATHVKPALDLEDPGDRVVPISTQYTCLLANTDLVDPPNTLEELHDPVYADQVTTTTPKRGGRGFSFLSWLFYSTDPAAARAIWQALRDNGLEERDGWDDVMASYIDGERSMALGYAGDALVGMDAQIEPEPDPDTGPDPDTDDQEAGNESVEDPTAGDDDEADDIDDGDGDDGESESGDGDEDETEPSDPQDNPPEQFEIRYLDGESYAEPRGMAIFDGAINLDLAYAFLEFALTADAQAGAIPRLGQYPARPLEQLTFSDEHTVYERYAREPDSIVTFPQATRRDDLPEWFQEWESALGEG